MNDHIAILAHAMGDDHVPLSNALSRRALRKQSFCLNGTAFAIRSAPDVSKCVFEDREEPNDVCAFQRRGTSAHVEMCDPSRSKYVRIAIRLLQQSLNRQRDSAILA